MHFFQTLRFLRPGGRRLLLRGAGALPLIALALRLFGFRRVYAALHRLEGSPRPPADAARRVRRTRRLINYLARHGPYRGNCLSRSLLLWWLLRRQGIESDLRIGVHLEAGQLRSHAWVEYRGHPLNDSEQVHGRFAAFDQPIAPEGVGSP